MRDAIDDISELMFNISTALSRAGASAQEPPVDTSGLLNALKLMTLQAASKLQPGTSKTITSRDGRVQTILSAGPVCTNGSDAGLAAYNMTGSVRGKDATAVLPGACTGVRWLFFPLL